MTPSRLWLGLNFKRLEVMQEIDSEVSYNMKEEQNKSSNLRRRLPGLYHLRPVDVLPVYLL
jgi:hypothetical protein